MENLEKQMTKWKHNYIQIFEISKEREVTHRSQAYRELTMSC